MGKKLIDLCKAHDLLVLNGRAVGDPHGKHTYYDSSQGASTINIAIASNPLLEQVKSFVVQQPDEFTKHYKNTLRIKNLKQLTMEGPNKKFLKSHYTLILYLRNHFIRNQGSEFKETRGLCWPMLPNAYLNHVVALQKKIVPIQ